MYLITGSRGQLGSELMRLVGDRAIGVSRDEFDMEDIDQMSKLLKSLRPSVIINCAAYTAVDLAEDNEGPCFGINSEAVKSLASIATEIDALLVQISTDYVFAQATDANGPLTESSTVSPIGVYARSKWHGEVHAASCPRHLIIRTCGLYGATPKRSNFVETMLRLGAQREELRVVDDQRCNPTSTLTLANAVLRLIEKDSQGVFHVVCSTSMSWYEFAKEIFAQASMPTRVMPVTTEEYGARAPRPRYSVLDTSKYARTTGCRLPTIQNDLAVYLNNHG